MFRQPQLKVLRPPINMGRREVILALMHFWDCSECRSSLDVLQGQVSAMDSQTSFQDVVPENEGKDLMSWGFILDELFFCSSKPSVGQMKSFLSYLQNTIKSPSMRGIYTAHERSSRIITANLMEGEENNCSMCAICIERLNGDIKCLQIERCKHVYHADCLDTWTSSRKSCPLCRQELRTEPEWCQKIGKFL